MYEIFKPAKEGEKGARMVLVEGNPGIGKTTFCLKFASDWAKKVVPVEFHFPVFQLLFFLKCCDIHKDTKDIVQAIEEQLLHDDMNNKKRFMNYIRDERNQDKILLILDGLDELPEASGKVVDRLFKRKVFSRCFILATSREENGIDVRRRYDFDTLLQIKGFTSKDARVYIRKHFNSVDPQNLSKGERLIQAVEKDLYLAVLRNNPLNLLLLCVVFEDFEGELPSNRTKLYQIIFRCLLRRYCSRNGLDVHRNADKTLENQFKESILVLGELAWKCLLEDRRSFSEEELDNIIDLCGEITSYGETALQKLVQGSPEHSISVHLNGVSKDRYLSGFDTLTNFSPPSASLLADGKTATHDEVIALLSCASSTTFNLTVNDHADMPGEWARGVAKGLANSRSLTTFSLTLNNLTDKGAEWAFYMSEGLPKCASLTTFSITVNNHIDERADWAVYMSEGLPYCASLTTFSLTVNNHTDEGANWACYISEGLPHCASLTTFSLTVNNHTDEGANWACYMSEGLPHCASLTTFSLTVNNHTDEGANWARYMSEGLPHGASLTTFSLIVNNHTDEGANWACYMGGGLPYSASLTTFILTVNNHTDEGANWARYMSGGLPKCASLTTFSLTVNNHTDKRAYWADYMSVGLPKCASLTTFSLTVNNYADAMESWAEGISEGLANSSSLATFSLTVNNHADMMGNWVRDISNGLQKNGSLTTIRVAFSLYGVHKIH
ncbi:Baculoviral IAP repeat-containing protein 1 [Stylophora pistillata]|uniref:Baculoviral IAP repeat-containing protein 1 n=1 Tax=Stylophora pistillata TaxID=50429 RepID=A0A2B4R9U1_STYPI|nr:Baculoviral IAP repeat-containing protein 1 [Stylophora pistillata]